jgi:hemerythrin HHE cation binding domain-containing protein
VADIVTLIETDHRALEEVFSSIEAADGDVKPLIEQVRDLLVPHSKAEEQVVYPAIKQIAPDESEDVDDGLEEHHHVEAMLKQVLAEDSDAPGADGIVAAIIGEVRHHVEEEEQLILPKFADKATPQQLDDLGAKFEAAKAAALAELRGSR